jgi:hypothetical protein
MGHRTTHLPHPIMHVRIDYCAKRPLLRPLNIYADTASVAVRADLGFGLSPLSVSTSRFLRRFRQGAVWFKGRRAHASTSEPFRLNNSSSRNVSGAGQPGTRSPPPNLKLDSTHPPVEPPTVPPDLGLGRTFQPQYTSTPPLKSRLRCGPTVASVARTNPNNCSTTHVNYVMC